MSAKVFKLVCPVYKFGASLDLNQVANCLDKVLLDNFAGQEVVLRGIQSQKHDLPKDKLVEQILKTGTDRHETSSDNDVSVSDQPIDLFGYACKVEGSIALPVLEGFHKWKPKSLERPHLKVDVWMVYDAAQLENIEYIHSHYGVKANDGYVFKDSDNNQQALLGILMVE